ncbi:hypothetical protein BK637_24360 [Pseudomonas chlororaphis]|nr:hypothetical protein BK637_24360 [Pseudomonas chlororaphis]
MAPAFLDQDVALAQSLYMSNLKEAHKGFKFLNYDVVEPYENAAMEYAKIFGRAYVLSQTLDIPEDIPIVDSRFTSVSGSVGGYKCQVRVVTGDYVGE